MGSLPQEFGKNVLSIHGNQPTGTDLRMHLLDVRQALKKSFTRHGREFSRLSFDEVVIGSRRLVDAVKQAHRVLEENQVQDPFLAELQGIVAAYESTDPTGHLFNVIANKCLHGPLWPKSRVDRQTSYRAHRMWYVLRTDKEEGKRHVEALGQLLNPLLSKAARDCLRKLSKVKGPID